MRSQRLLATFLLGVSLCFVPALGHGEVKQSLCEDKSSSMDLRLLQARIDYMMIWPTDFLIVDFHYDTTGSLGIRVQHEVDTKGKIYVSVQDNRDVFTDKGGLTLLQQFKKELEKIDRFLWTIAPKMDTDVVAKFYGRGAKTLGYFYQGEYHLWGE